MKRLVNVRIPAILAIAFTVGISLGYIFVYYGISLFWITAVVPITAVITIFTAVLSKDYLKIIIILLTALFFVSGTVDCFIRLDYYTRARLVNGETYTVSASVCEKGKTSNGEYVILDSASADGEKADGKIIVYLGSTYGDFCDVGYKVNFTAQIYRKDAFPYGKLNYSAQDNVKYSCNVSGGMTAKYGYSFFGSILSRIRDTLYYNLDEDTAAIAFAMLTGNTQGVDDGTMGSFRYGGIAHIFAVSGLHIGILYGCLYMIFKKVRLNKYVAAVLCILTLIFYAGVCGFTLSSVRAVVMCTVSSAARLVYKKYDGLNALSLAVILILAISPLSLFSVGFQLSACATAGILLLSRSISKTISRPFKKLPRQISGAVGVSLSAQAGTMPIMLADFGYLSGAGLLLNIIILPLLSLIYVIIFIGTIIAAVIPPSAVILPYAVLPLEFVISIFNIAGFEKALISGFGAGAFLPVFYIGLLALSDKLNVKIWYRLTAVISAVIFLCSYVFMNMLAPFNGYKIVVSAYYGGGEVLIKSNGENVLIITEGLLPSQTQSTLNEYYANDLSAVIILGGDSCVSSFNGFDLNCKNLYVYYGYVNVQPYANRTVNYESEFEVGGINFSFTDGYSLLADCDGVKIAVCAGNVIPFESCDLLITDNAFNGCDRDFTVGFNERSIEFNVYDCGNFIFSVKNGELK